jgi:DNA-binding LacI/PurR family transcriptional regulator
VIAASSLGARQGDWLTAPPIPVVLVNTAAPEADVPTIMSDNQSGSRMVAEHLLGLGHRRFGYLMPPPRHVDAPDRLAGVRRALREADLAPEALQVARGEALVWGGEVAADELLDRSPETTAFVAYNDLMAIGALRALRRRGRRVPAEASVAGFDDVAMAAYVDPPLTTIAQRTDEMGRWAVARLVGEEGLGPSSVLLPVDLRIRESTGPVPA